MVAAGNLNRRVTILRPVAGKDGAGQPSSSFETYVTLWGSLRTPSGLRALQADANISTAKASIRLRYRTDIDATMRAQVDGKTYYIRAVLPDGHVSIDLVCEQVQ